MKAYVVGIQAAVDDGGDGGCVGSGSEGTEKGGLRGCHVENTSILFTFILV